MNRRSFITRLAASAASMVALPVAAKLNIPAPAIEQPFTKDTGPAAPKGDGKGARVEVNEATGSMNVYDADGVLRVRFGQL